MSPRPVKQLSSLICLLAIPLLAAVLHAEERTAFVLCVSDYRGTGTEAISSLPGTGRDRELMVHALTEAGFDVTALTDPTREEAVAGIRAYLEKLRQGRGAGLFYFSGHGAVFEGANYLVLGRAPIRSGEDLAWTSLAAQEVLEAMEATGAEPRILLLDCCRNNPFEPDNLFATLTSAKLKGGSYISYAAPEGNVSAATETGSLFTLAYCRQMAKEGASLFDVHTRVAREVFEQIGRTPPQVAALRQSWSYHPFAPAATVRPAELLPGDLRLFGGLPFAWCPPGEFLMGASPQESSQEVMAPAATRVKLTHGFWMSQTEVTQSQWEEVMGVTVGRDPALLRVEREKGTKPGPWATSWETSAYPMVGVTWEEAVTFCHRLNQALKDELPPGMRFNLPSEAQWEYACRAGTTTAYGFGDDPKRLTDFATVQTDRFQLDDGIDLASIDDAPWRKPSLISDLKPAPATGLNPPFLLPQGGSLPDLLIPPSETMNRLRTLQELGSDDLRPDLREELIDLTATPKTPEQPSEKPQAATQLPLLSERKPVSLAPSIPRIRQHRTNDWLLYDLHGNVAEWCLDSPSSVGDVLRELELKKKNILEDPVHLGGSSELQRIVRGGSFRSPARECRSWSRSHRQADATHDDLGFRIVLGFTEVPEVPGFPKHPAPEAIPGFKLSRMASELDLDLLQYESHVIRLDQK